MKIEILDRAEEDLVNGFFFYEAHQKGLGSYFLDSLYSDIDSLHLYGGLHQNVYKVYHRLLSRRFPFAIFYTITEDSLLIHAILDCRSDPAWIRDRLEKKSGI